MAKIVVKTNPALPSFEELYRTDSFEGYTHLAFMNIKHMLDCLNLTPRKYSELTGYNYGTVMSWIKGTLEPPSGRNIHGATLYRHKGRVWVNLHGAKTRIEYKGEIATLNENTGRVVGKSWEMTGNIIDNGSLVKKSWFLLNSSK
jgi:hypothetical protein